MNLTFEAFIKLHYGSQDNMDSALDLGSKTVNRWYNHDPRKFLYHMPEVVTQTKVAPSTFLQMINQREYDIRLVRHGHGGDKGNEKGVSDTPQLFVAEGQKK